MQSLPDRILPREKTFGVAIDVTSVRGVELDRAGKVVEHVAEVKFPKSVFQNGIVVEPKVLQQSFEQLKQLGKFSTSYVSVAVPESFAYTRELQIPVIPLTEVREAVDWKARELFPFPRESMYIDWRLLGQDESNLQLSVVAVLKESIDPIVAALHAAGLKPLTVEPDASLLAKIVGVASPQHAIVTDINRHGALVTLVEGDKAIFTTVVPFTQQDTPKSYLDHIKQTLAEVTTFYRQKKVIIEKDVEIVLTGDVASDSWLNELPHPAKILRTPIRNPAFTKAYATAVFAGRKPVFSERINVLPDGIKRQHETERKILFYKTLFGRASAVVGAYIVVVAVILGILMLERTENERIIAETSLRIEAQQSQSSRSLLALNGAARSIVALAPFKATPRESLEAFLALIPEDITIQSIEYDDQSLSFSIAGVATDREGLLAFKSILEESPQFTKVILPLAVLELSETIPFTMTFTRG